MGTASPLRQSETQAPQVSSAAKSSTLLDSTEPLEKGRDRAKETYKENY